jgi:hypothetical protein
LKGADECQKGIEDRNITEEALQGQSELKTDEKHSEGGGTKNPSSSSTTPNGQLERVINKQIGVGASSVGQVSIPPQLNGETGLRRSNHKVQQGAKLLREDAAVNPNSTSNKLRFITYW